MEKNPLGRTLAYPERYDPGLLYAIPRWASRSMLDIDKKLPLFGFDHWRAYEVSWLDRNGKPHVGVGEFCIDARSENTVESKSLKLYLNSLNNEAFGGPQEVQARIATDVSTLTRSEVSVRITALGAPALGRIDAPRGECLDELDSVSGRAAGPDAGLLAVGQGYVKDRWLHSNLFRSNCPVTGQPDWATCQVFYSGREIERGALLAYLCSYRSHQGYHEQCAEMILRDLTLACAPQQLVVGMNFTRRGGLEINPWRSSRPLDPEGLVARFVRQ